MGIAVHEAGDPAPSGRALLPGESPGAFFLDPAWIQAVTAGYANVRPRYLLLEEDGATTAVLPWAEVSHGMLREAVSMPFGTPGGPVLGPNASDPGLAALGAAFRSVTRRPGTFRFELTLLDPGDRVRLGMEAHFGRHRLPADVPVLDLRPGAEALWQGYEQQLRRSLRRAEKAGVRTRRGRGEFPAFYRLYADQAREWSLPWRHRARALERIVDSLGDRAEIWIASREELDLCGQLVLVRPGGEIHFWLSGARPESRPLAAFHFLLHEIILDASRRGFHACHFGTSLGNTGVEQFKLAYGAVQKPLLRFFHQPRWVGWIQKARW